MLYDVAFLIMDLWRRGRKREANAVFNHYLEGAAPADLEGLALLPLFLSIRAGIRAMTGVHALRLRQSPGRHEAILAIKAYALLAEAFLDSEEPSLIAVGGLSGTGKTTVAQEIAPSIGAAPGALHLRTDVERKLMRGGVSRSACHSAFIAVKAALAPTGMCLERRKRHLEWGNRWWWMLFFPSLPKEATRDGSPERQMRASMVFGFMRRASVCASASLRAKAMLRTPTLPCSRSSRRLSSRLLDGE